MIRGIVVKLLESWQPNLNYLYLIGRLSEFDERRVQRWWTSALFLALDRLIEDRSVRQEVASIGQSAEICWIVLSFTSLAVVAVWKRIWQRNICCGCTVRAALGRGLPSPKLRRDIGFLPDLHWFANRAEPVGAIHPTNQRLVKIIPRACAMLAFYLAGFVSVDLEELDSMDVDEFIRSRTKEALRDLCAAGVSPTDEGAEDLMKLTRGR